MNQKKMKKPTHKNREEIKSVQRKYEQREQATIKKIIKTLCWFFERYTKLTNILIKQEKEQRFKKNKRKKHCNEYHSEKSIIRQYYE